MLFRSAVASSSIFYDRMLIGTSGQTWTFAEAAYASMVALSWQNIVIGDPLTRYVVQMPTSSAQWQTYLSHGEAEYLDQAPQNKVISGARGLSRLRVVLNKEPAAATVNCGALSITGQTSGNLSSLINSVTVLQCEANWLLEITLSESLPDCDRYTFALTGLRDKDRYPFYLNTTLQLALLSGDVDGSGAVDANDVAAARAAAIAGQPVGESNYHLNASGSGLFNGENMRFINQDRKSVV